MGTNDTYLGTYYTGFYNCSDTCNNVSLESMDQQQNTSNSTASNFSFVGLYPELKHDTLVILVYSVAYTVVFLLAFFGNLIVVAVVCKNRWMHTKTNFFIVNLAIADMLVAIFVIPITLLTNIFTEWRYGAVMCKLTPFLQGVSVCASVNTLAAIALDRYLAICYTLNYKMNWRTSKFIMCLVWMFSLALMSPNIIFFKRSKVKNGIQELWICYQQWPSVEIQKIYFLAGVVLFCYTIPLVLIVTCYCLIGYRVWHRDAPGVFRSNGVIRKSKVKVVKMLVVVVVVFALSWFPLWAVNLRLQFDPPQDLNTINLFHRYVIPICQWLGSSNSGINPIIYCLFSKKIRMRIKTMIMCENSSNDYSRHLSRFSSTRYVSVDYTNGHVTLRTYGAYKDRRSMRNDRSFNNIYD